MARTYGIDVSVFAGPSADDATAADLRLRAVVRGRDETKLDLALVDGRDNLAQALVLRLLTPLGSLAALGHASYGSRLHELIGRNRTPAIRNLCRAFVLEAVAQEPRVEPRAVGLEFDTAAEGPFELRFTVGVRPRGGGDPIHVAVEVGL